MSNPSRKALYREARRLTRYGRPRRHRYFVREHIAEIGPTTMTIGGQTYPVVANSITLTREVPPPMLFGGPDDAPGTRQLTGTITGYLRGHAST